MKVIVCGAGQVGWQIARHLSSENNDECVILSYVNVRILIALNRNVCPSPVILHEKNLVNDRPCQKLPSRRTQR